MRLSPVTGHGLMGIGTIAISIDGVVPPAMTALTGGGWAWLTDDICGGQGQGWSLVGSGCISMSSPRIL